MLQFVITKKSKFLAFIWLVPLLKYPLIPLRELKYLNSRDEITVLQTDFDINSAS